MNENSRRFQFEARIEKADDGMDTAYVSFPYNVSDVFGTKGQVKVKASFDGQPYRGVLANMGTGCHAIGLRKDIRAIIKKGVGDLVQVELERDTEERTLEIPEAMEKVLKKNPLAKKFFESLSFTNRKEYVAWIRDAKKEETKQRRLELLFEKLSGGKKNPTEK
jgi:hypothetical protein